VFSVFRRNKKTFILLTIGLLLALSAIYVFAQNYKVFTGRWSNRLTAAGALADADNQRPLGEMPAPTDAAIRDLVVFPNAAVELIAGPQLKSGSPLNPYPLFDSIAASRGMRNAKAVPSIPTMKLTGALFVTRGSIVVTGSGTRFTTQIDPNGPAPLFNGRLRIRDRDGATMRVVQVATIQSDTQLTLTSPWGYSAVTGAIADTDYNDEWEGWAHDASIGRN